MNLSPELLAALEPKLKALGVSIQELFVSELRAVMTEVAIPEIKALFLQAYDELADYEEGEMGAAVRGKDPLTLKRLRPLFEKQLSDELVKKVKVTDDGVEIGILDENLLGYGEDATEGPPVSIDVLNFYIEGVWGAFGFITPEQYAKRGRRSSKPLGRLGAGFLIPEERYRSERWAEETGVPFEEVRHAISNQRPYRGFHEAASRINFTKYAEEAMRRVGTRLNGSGLRG